VKKISLITKANAPWISKKKIITLFISLTFFNGNKSTAYFAGKHEEIVFKYLLKKNS